MTSAILLIWWFAHKVFCVDESDSDSIILSGEELGAIEHVEELLEACFNQEFETRQKAAFLVEAIDFEDRDVRLEFEVSIDPQQHSCLLEWSGGAPKKGNIQSTDVKSGNRTVPLDINALMELRILIFEDHIELISLHPNGLFSGRFVKGLFCAIRDACQTVNGNTLMTLIRDDCSNNRELYWLVQGTGRTYFEGAWDVEYSCLLSEYSGSPSLTEFLQMSMDAQLLPARTAIFQNEFPYWPGYQPLPGLQHPDMFKFDQRFIGSLELYKETKSPEDLERMTIRDVLKEFMPTFLNNPEYSVHHITYLSQNTFIYFFRNHPNFTSLARQVLVGYDHACGTLVGYPHNTDGLEFDFTYSLEITSILQFRANIGEVVAANSASSGNAGSQQRNDASNSEAGPSNLEEFDSFSQIGSLLSQYQQTDTTTADSHRDKKQRSEPNEEHVSQATLKNSHVYYILFTFIFITILYSTFIGNGTSSNHFDIYVEI